MITKTCLDELSIYLLYLLKYIISVMIFNFLIRDFGHPKFLNSQFGHPVMKILAKSLPAWTPQKVLNAVDPTIIAKLEY